MRDPFIPPDVAAEAASLIAACGRDPALSETQKALFGVVTEPFMGWLIGAINGRADGEEVAVGVASVCAWMVAQSAIAMTGGDRAAAAHNAGIIAAGIDDGVVRCLNAAAIGSFPMVNRQ